LKEWRAGCIGPFPILLSIPSSDWRFQRLCWTWCRICDAWCSSHNTQSQHSHRVMSCILSFAKRGGVRSCISAFFSF